MQKLEEEKTDVQKSKVNLGCPQIRHYLWTFFRTLVEKIYKNTKKEEQTRQ